MQQHWKIFCFGWVGLILSLSPAFSQQLDFDNIILPAEQRAKDFEDFLVQLAWMNMPDNQALSKKVDIAKEEEKMAKLSWSESVGGSIGVLPGGGAFSIDTVNNVGTFLPRYNYGVSVNLMPLVTLKNKVKIAQEEVEIAEMVLNQEKLAVRANLLERYQDYLLAIEILKARQNAEQDANGIYQYIAELFRADEAPFEDYSKASTAYHDAVEKRIEAESLIEQAIIKIEEMIGIELTLAERLFKGKR